MNTLPKRRTVRLYGYDYSQEGLYFVTVCCQDKICRFGKVENGEMVLNRMGEIAYNEWFKTAELRPNIRLDEFIIMPNHIHGIIEITDNVGANCIRPNNENTDNTGVCNTPLQENNNILRSPSQTIGAIIRGYKSAVTKQINNICKTENVQIWQRNDYGHIIRNTESHQKITDYILTNPLNWVNDKYYSQ